VSVRRPDFSFAAFVPAFFRGQKARDFRKRVLQDPLAEFRKLKKKPAEALFSAVETWPSESVEIL
jgi:hypothetical protein